MVIDRADATGLGCAENFICPGGRSYRFRWGPPELVALPTSRHCGMMIGCAASTGLPRCDERVRVTATVRTENLVQVMRPGGTR
jgi:hypothetical protein